MSNTDPLKYLFEEFGYNPTDVCRVVSGEVYTAVVLNNGNVGLCSGLSLKADFEVISENALNLELMEHRLYMSAYYSALLNYTEKFTGDGDVTSAVDFSPYESIVMLGYFKPLVRKFENWGVDVKIFDHKKTDKLLQSMDLQHDAMSKADCIIATATTIFNKTYLEIVKAVQINCEVIILGPSAILHKDLMKRFGMKHIFGTTFSKNDEELLAIVKRGGGAQDFKHLGKKVFL